MVGRMARPLRIEYPGAFYHVLNRGHRQGAIVDSVRDRQQFLLYLERMARQYSVVVHGYCVMAYLGTVAYLGTAYTIHHPNKYAVPGFDPDLKQARDMARMRQASTNNE